jgi:hypothetical protein
MAEDFTQLVTPLHQQDKFLAVVAAFTDGLGQITDATQALTVQYGLDTAEGAQLDVVGKWVGIGRDVRTPVDNQFFTWDTAGKGWDEGYWKGAFVPTEGVASLDDLSYRAALRLKVMQNTWAGPFEAFYTRWILLEGATPNLLVVRDNMDMSVDVAFYGPIISTFLRLFIEQQVLVPKPLGVRINSYTYTGGFGGGGGGGGLMTNLPVFGLDEASFSINGLDFGYLI